MGALILQAARLTARFGEMVAPKLHALHQRFLRGIEALAEARMRKAQEEIDRCRHLVHAHHNSPVKTLHIGR